MNLNSMDTMQFEIKTKENPLQLSGIKCEQEIKLEPDDSESLMEEEHLDIEPQIELTEIPYNEAEVADNSLDIYKDSSTNSDNREALLNFIENYRELRMLWDVSSKEYSNKDKKNEAYGKLLEIYKRIKRNATREDVKKKINSLRTNFRKEFKKVEASKRSGASANEVYKPKCWIFKELSFLIESSSSYVIPSVASENQEIREVGINISKIECDESEVIAQSSIGIPSSKKFKKSKRMEISPTERQNDLINIACEYLKKGNGEEDAVAKGWACKLLRMNPVQRIWAQKFVNDILTEGELGTLHHNSVCINQHQIQHLPSTPSSAHSVTTSSSTVVINDASPQTEIQQKVGEHCHSCEFCNRSFSSESILKTHVCMYSDRHVHSGLRSHKCSICNKSFLTKRYLRVHVQIHNTERPFLCDICNKSFKGKINLYKHKLIHSEGRPYKCEICNISYKHKCTLYSHNWKVHSPIRPYKCDMCDKSFKDRSHLVKHWCVHTQERPHACDICGKSFNDKSNLYQHQRIHSEDRPYVCDLCGKSFTNQGYLCKHRRVHSEERQFICDICNKSFRHRKDLTKHILLHS